MLLIAAHVLGDIDRWWNQHGLDIEGDVQAGDLYRLLHQTAVEAEAAWSHAQPTSRRESNFHRHGPALPITLLLIEFRPGPDRVGRPGFIPQTEAGFEQENILFQIAVLMRQSFETPELHVSVWRGASIGYPIWVDWPITPEIRS